MGEWRDIETAPKDGTVLIAATYCGVEAVKWADANRYTRTDAGWMGVEHDSPCQPGSGDERRAMCQPTHWQPFPAPPGTTPAPADLRSALEAETIKRCAKVAEDHGAAWVEHQGFANVIATAIRALAPTKGDVS